MAIPAGTRLRHFEIASLLGAGGMGEVYKARDTRLDRIVAIKVLPAHLADKPELRERFEREARTISCRMDPKAMLWNHPAPPPRQPRPGELLFEFIRASDRAPMSCELRFHGESYGWEVNRHMATLSNGEKISCG